MEDITAWINFHLEGELDRGVLMNSSRGSLKFELETQIARVFGFVPTRIYFKLFPNGHHMDDFLIFGRSLEESSDLKSTLTSSSILSLEQV
jgi:hypothetical protein